MIRFLGVLYDLILIIIFVLILSGLGLGAGILTAHAHEHSPEGEYLGAGWIAAEDSYRDMNNSSIHCCGERDCAAWPEENVEVTPDGYKLSTGELIPFEKAYATPPEKAAESLYWRCHKQKAVLDGEGGLAGVEPGDTRCFWAPQPGF